MNAYLYDEENFYYAIRELMESPLEPGIFGDLPFSTKEKPPEIQKNEIQFWNGTEWEIKPDFSGKTYYSKIDKSEKIFLKGEPFSENYTDLKPPELPESEYYTFQENAWKIDSNLKKQYDLKLCKNTSIGKLYRTDWTQLPDRSIMIENLQDFIEYRNKLLELVLNPIENPIFPTEPKAIWK